MKTNKNLQGSIEQWKMTGLEIFKKLLNLYWKVLA